MSLPEHQITGLAFIGSEFTPENVDIFIKNGTISDIIPSKKPITQCILPAFFNAHTHIGDTIALDTPANLPLAELVAPPNGLKHKILNQTPAETIRAGMKHSLGFMKARGTLGFADFREGGMEGVDMLAGELDPEMTAVILGRNGGEMHPLATGIGLSSAHGTDEERELAKKTRGAKKLVAVHAGEAGIADIDAAFALEPDLIIHATHFRNKDIQQAADEGTAIAVCPRSNWILHVSNSPANPPIKELIDAGIPVYLGTDNAMFVPPDMFSECAFLMDVYGISAEDTLRMATTGFNLINEKTGIEIGNPARLTILDGNGLLDWSRYPLRTALARLGSAAVRAVITPHNQ
ncbi:MAG TPA: amidohydrolase family protein [Methanocorpusculum sp.]|nr:amidohydrolase family protein [Methanocorpusculum sp.]